jgi:predicted DNA-binding transcriptional regulator AlpA
MDSIVHDAGGASSPQPTSTADVSEDAMPRAYGARSGRVDSHTAAAEVLFIGHTETARRLGVSPSHLHNLRKSGRFGPTPTRLGRSVRFLAREVAAWAAAGSPARDRWAAIKSAHSTNRRAG